MPWSSNAGRLVLGPLCYITLSGERIFRWFWFCKKESTVKWWETLLKPSFTILKILAQSTNDVDIKHWCFGKILVILGGLDILLQYWFRKQAKVSVFVSDRIQYHEPTQTSSNREIIWETLFTVMWQQWSVGVYRMDSDDDINHIWKFCYEEKTTNLYFRLLEYLLETMGLFVLH